MENQHKYGASDHNHHWANVGHDDRVVQQGLRLRSCSAINVQETFQ